MPRVRTIVTGCHTVAVTHRLVRVESSDVDWVLVIEVAQLDPCDPTREPVTSTMEGAWGE